MSSPSRRSVLRLGGSALVAGLAGCSALTGDPSPTRMRLGELEVLNLDDDPHTVQVLIEADGEPVYWNSMDAAAFDDDGRVAGGGVFEDVPDEPGSYDVYARYEDQPPGEWVNYGIASLADSYAGEDDVPCVSLNVHVGDLQDPSDPPRISIWKSIGC